MVGSPRGALVHARGGGNGGGDAAAGPLTRRTFQTSPRLQASTLKRNKLDTSAQLRAISLEYTHAELLAATQNWHPSRKLGAGCYGAVYRGELRDGSEVAIKAIDLGALMGKGESPEDAGFDEEVQMLSKFRHPNLVTLLGWGQHEMSRYLVYEFLAGGDVFHRLHRSRKPGEQLFYWHERLSAILDASTGLSHMHNSTPKAFHRDIKSANILLDRHGTAKMADFGLSCTSGLLHVTTKTINGTPGYKCPIYERTGCFTEGSEVFSFGMVVLEILTGLDPSATDPKAPGGIAFPLEEAMMLSRPGAVDRCVKGVDALAGWPPPLAREVAGLALRGVSLQDDRQRPAFLEVVRALRGMSERFPAGGDTRSLQPIACPKAVPALTPGPKPSALQQQQPAQVSVAATQQQHQQQQQRQQQQQYQRSAGPQRPRDRSASRTLHSITETTLAVSAGIAGTRSVAVEVPVSAVTSHDNARSAVLHFYFELSLATGLCVDTLSAESRRLPLTTCSSTSAGGLLTASVGRKHQPGVFEAWLPDPSRCSCISRTAFDVQWSPHSDNVWLIARGSNPLSVDGKVARNGTSVTLRSGSEVRFTYDLRVILGLRFVLFGRSVEVAAEGPAAEVDTSGKASSATSSAPSPAIGALEASVSSTTLWSVSQTHLLDIDGSSQRFREQELILEDIDSVSIAVERLNLGLVHCPNGFCIVRSAAQQAWFLLYRKGMKDAGFACLGISGDPVAQPPPPPPPPPPLPFTGLASTRPRALAARQASSLEPPLLARRLSDWSLACVHTDGLPEEGFQQLPPELCQIPVPEGVTLVGRQHQPDQFEAWLPDAVLRFCISRTHLQLVACRGGLRVANLSTSFLCVDQEPMTKGEVRPLSEGQILSFARHDNGVHVQFLALQVRTAKKLSARGKSPDEFRRCPAHRGSLDSGTERPGVAASRNSQLGASASPAQWSRKLSIVRSPSASTQRKSHDATDAPQLIEVHGQFAAPPEEFCTLDTEGSATFQAAPSSHATLTSLASRGVTLAAWLSCDSNDSLGSEPRQAFGQPQTFAERAAAMVSAAKAGSHVEGAAAAPPTPATPPAAAGRAVRVAPLRSVTPQGCTASAPAAPLEPQNSSLRWQQTLGEEHSAALEARRQISGRQERSPDRARAAGEVPTKMRSLAFSDAAAPERKNDAPPQVVLELSGECVLDVALNERCIGPISLARPLLVGWRHQPELYKRAVTKECQELLSRDHFCIAYEDGEFWLLVVTPDWIWHARNGETPSQLKRDTIITLKAGDCIALGTGGDASSADTVHGMLFWHFRVVGGQVTGNTC